MNAKEHDIGLEHHAYYSSSQGPFYNATNLYMFFGGGDRAEVVDRVISALRTQGKPVHIHGEAGSGKTLLSLVIEDRIKHQYSTIRYDLPKLSASKLLRHLLIELCPRHSQLLTAEQARQGVGQPVVDEVLECIESQLTLNHVPHGKPYVLFIDSNDELDETTLMVLEKLSEIQVQHEQVINCIVSRRSHDEDMEANGSSVYRHGFDNHFWLRRLSLSETTQYLHHHMMLFDYTRQNMFTPEMAYFIADRSKGVFKSINTLARNAFTIAKLQDAEKLSMSHLLMAGMPLVEEEPVGKNFFYRFRGALITAFAVNIIVLTAITVFVLR